MIKRQLRYGWGGWIRTNDHGIKTRQRWWIATPNPWMLSDIFATYNCYVPYAWNSVWFQRQTA